MSSNKVVKVTYYLDDVFCIPKNINLEDKSQVKDWCIKWNVLHITLTNGKELEISAQGVIEGYDYKYPDEKEILGLEGVCIDEDDEGFNEVDI